jgi:hypothetical protein
MRSHSTFLLKVIIVFHLSLAVTSSAFSVTLFDDFSGQRIDPSKWNTSDQTEEAYISNGKLFRLFQGYTGSSGEDYANLNFKNPESVYAFKTSVTIHSYEHSFNVWPYLLTGGHFYSDGYGDVWASLSIQNHGEGFKAYWTLFSLGRKQSLNSGVFEEDLQSGMPFEIEIAYAEASNQFTFRVNAETATSIGIDKVGPPTFQWKTLDLGSLGEPFGGPFTILASFDDVYINNQPTVYDDFSSSTIDTSKWGINTSKVVREIEDGKLNLFVDGKDKKTSSNIHLNKLMKYIQATVSVDGMTSVSAGAYGKVRLGGQYYNDSHGPGSGKDYNGSLGEIWAEIRLMIDDNGQLKAVADIERADDPGWSTYTVQYNHEFTQTINKDSDYILSIAFNNSKFIFRCDAESSEYYVKTPVYQSSQGDHWITSRVYLDPGEEGVFSAHIDDFYVVEEYGVEIVPVLNLLLLH